MTAAEIRASCWPAILPALRLRMPPILLDLGDEPFGKLSARGRVGSLGTGAVDSMRVSRTWNPSDPPVMLSVREKP